VLSEERGGEKGLGFIEMLCEEIRWCGRDGGQNQAAC
jgi:hypothetical protein